MAKAPQAPRNAALFRQIAAVELKKGELRKLQIVEATIRCLAARGWLGTNYETVGQACGMKRPHVAYYYPEWHDLLADVFRLVYATGASVVGDYLRETSGESPPFRTYVEGTFHWLRQHPEQHGAITLLWHMATFDKRFRALSTEVKRLGAERIHAILYGSAPVNRRSERWKRALTLHGLVVGRCIELMATDTGVDVAKIVKEIAAEVR